MNNRVAALQMVSGSEIKENLTTVTRLAKSAVDGGAQLFLLPENFALMSTKKLYAAGVEERSSSGPIRSTLSRLAKQLNVWVVAGSVPVAMRPDGELLDSRVRQVCFVYDNNGGEVARYDKIHLFDVDVKDQQGSYRESATMEPGDRSVVVETPVGRLGLSICYDLRFPELYRDMLSKGAELFSVPAAFTAKTGEAHWEVLLRARAIENLCYVIAANQGGWHSPSRETWGQSMIVNPWGEILAQRAKGDAVVFADIDLEALRDTRQQMPIQSHRRL